MILQKLGNKDRDIFFQQFGARLLTDKIIFSRIFYKKVLYISVCLRSEPSKSQVKTIS